MITADLNTLKLVEGWFENDPDTRARCNFPLYAVHGTKSTAVVYFELEPGKALGEHTDSAEEILLVLDGTVEATLGEEKGVLSKGQMALIPETVAHNVRNVGDDRARLIGFFAAGMVRSTFTQPMMPIGQRELGTPPAEMLKAMMEMAK